MSTTITLLTLPFLILISIPLIITAFITIFFSVVALSLQLAIISIELCYALVTNLFTIPPSPNWSLLSFSVSGPNTPVRRRSSDYSILHTPLAVRNQDQIQSWSGRPSLGPRMGSSNPLIDSQDTLPTMNLKYENKQRNNSTNITQHKNSSGFFGLINGDEDRDFEGLGGWRCPPSYTKSPGYRSGHTTPSSSKSNSISDEVDDIAWLSMNSRLELPSQHFPLMLRHSNHSNSASMHNLAQATHGGSSGGDASISPDPQPHLPWRTRSSKNSIGGMPSTVSAVTDPKWSKNKGQKRHHRRSATTSALALSGSVSRLGILSASQVHLRQAQNQNQYQGLDSCRGRTQTQMATQSRSDALRSKSHTSLSEHWRQNQTTGFASVSSSWARGPNPLSASAGTGAQTTSNTTPNEERKPAKIATAAQECGGTRKAPAHQVHSLGSR
ncbi:uncharacterized protein BDW70DRAFT_146702 [Aspergillus foveolatus]|uniref:uncharacterized protein n=1 Tax=Aspergillus foveolatus TaxID=210207 RepID=UPI003CCD96C6